MVDAISGERQTSKKSRVPLAWLYSVPVSGCEGGDRGEGRTGEVSTGFTSVGRISD